MKVRAFLLVVIVGALIWLAFTTRGGSDSNEPATTPSVGSTPSDSSMSREQSTPQQRSAPDEAAAEQETCFSQFVLESHPMFADEATRLEATSVTGPTMEGYRELSEAALQNLAIQKDSAAMAVLGARYLLEALGDDPDAAVSLLKGEHRYVWQPIPRPLPDSVSESANQAKYWFYQSALHGRIDALERFGWTIQIFEAGAVDLGWVDQATFDSMNNRERSALIPANVYNMARLNIAPELADGPLGELTLSLVPSTERSVPIINQVSEKFLQDLQSAGLPRPSIAPTALPDIDGLVSMLCEEDRKRLEAEVRD